MTSSTGVTIRTIEPADLEAALTLNNSAVPAVNPHDHDSWTAHVARSSTTWVAEVTDLAQPQLAGFLITFLPGVDYASANYGWLNERFDQFSYVDRIVVAPNVRGRGVGRALYRAHETLATDHGCRRVLCEVNVDPPNPESVAFHESVGWRGVADVEQSPGYVVRFFEKALAPEPRS